MNPAAELLDLRANKYCNSYSKAYPSKMCIRNVVARACDSEECTSNQRYNTWRFWCKNSTQRLVSNSLKSYQKAILSDITVVRHSHGLLLYLLQVLNLTHGASIPYFPEILLMTETKLKEVRLEKNRISTIPKPVYCK